METNFNQLLLHTAFAVMACDGDIATEEVQLIKDYANDKKSFGDIDVDFELNKLVDEINQKGKRFLKEFLSLVSETVMTEVQELQLLTIAVKMIQADQKIEYSEIKFFKVLRRNLKLVKDETILEKVEGIDEMYLAQDIRADYLRLFDDYFNNIELPKFEIAAIGKS